MFRPYLKTTLSYATSNKKARSAFFHRSLVDIHQEFASRLGCPLKKETDIEISVKCLQEKSVSDLMNSLKIFDQCNSKYILIYSTLLHLENTKKFMLFSNPISLFLQTFVFEMLEILGLLIAISICFD